MMNASLARILNAGILVSGLIFLSTGCGKKDSNDNPAPIIPNGDQQKSDLPKLVTTYCSGCHSGNAAKADVHLDSMDNAKKYADKAIEELSGGDMPPKEANAQPSDADRTALEDWFKSIR